MARLTTVAVSFLAATGTAAAQSWEAKTELRPDSKSTCPKAALIYEFTVAGSELVAKPRGGGHALTGSVSADGQVALHNRTPALGQVIISGNVRSRDAGDLVQLSGLHLRFPGRRHERRTGIGLPAA